MSSPDLSPKARHPSTTQHAHGDFDTLFHSEGPAPGSPLSYATRQEEQRTDTGLQRQQEADAAAGPSAVELLSSTQADSDVEQQGQPSIDRPARQGTGSQAHPTKQEGRHGQQSAGSCSAEQEREHGQQRAGINSAEQEGGQSVAPSPDSAAEASHQQPASSGASAAEPEQGQTAPGSVTARSAQSAAAGEASPFSRPAAEAGADAGRSEPSSGGEPPPEPLSVLLRRSRTLSGGSATADFALSDAESISPREDAQDSPTAQLLVGGRRRGAPEPEQDHSADSRHKVVSNGPSSSPGGLQAWHVGPPESVADSGRGKAAAAPREGPAAGSEGSRVHEPATVSSHATSGKDSWAASSSSSCVAASDDLDLSTGRSAQTGPGVPAAADAAGKEQSPGQQQHQQQAALGSPSHLAAGDGESSTANVAWEGPSGEEPVSKQVPSASQHGSPAAPEEPAASSRDARASRRASRQIASPQQTSPAAFSSGKEGAAAPAGVTDPRLAAALALRLQRAGSGVGAPQQSVQTLGEAPDQEDRNAGNYYTEALAEFQREQAALELDLLKRQQQELLQHLQRQQVLVQQQEQEQALAAAASQAPAAAGLAPPTGAGSDAAAVSKTESLSAMFEDNLRKLRERLQQEQEQVGRAAQAQASAELTPGGELEQLHQQAHGGLAGAAAPPEAALSGAPSGEAPAPELPLAGAEEQARQAVSATQQAQQPSPAASPTVPASDAEYSASQGDEAASVASASEAGPDAAGQQAATAESSKGDWAVVREGGSGAQLTDLQARMRSHERPGSPENPVSQKSWRRQRRHVFILSNAGKPIWALHGSEDALAGFMAVIQAMLAFVQGRGDRMHSMRAGARLFVFLEQGPLILVAVSTAGEPEPWLQLQMQLLHGQLVSILTSSLERMFARNPSYDLRALLGGTGEVLQSLVASFETDPSALLRAICPLPLAASLRHKAVVALHTAVKACGALYGMLLTDAAVVALSQPKAHPLHPHDLLLVANFVRASEGFRQAQSFTPVCLPRFNNSAFLHALVTYLHQASGLCLVLLAPRTDAFYELATAAQQLQQQLEKAEVIKGIAEGVEGDAHSGLLRIDFLPTQAGGGSVGNTPLLHFLYKSVGRGQVLMPAYTAPLDRPECQQLVMPAYARAHAAMFRSAEAARAARLASAAAGRSGKGPASSRAESPSLPPHRVHWVVDDNFALLAFAGAEYEVYALFDALTDCATAQTITQKLSAYIKVQHADLFMPL